MTRPAMVVRLCCTAALMLCLHPAQALAHARLRKSDPAANARLTSAPKVLRLWFTEAPEVALTTIAVLDSAGQPLLVGTPERDGEGNDGVRVILREVLANGSYTVKWRTAAADGHPSSGSFTFRVAVAASPHDSVTAHPAVTHSVAAPPAAAQPAAPEASALEPAYVGMRAVSFLALLLIIGAVTFRFAVVKRVMSLDALVRANLNAEAAKGAAVMTLVLLIAAVGRLWLQGRMLAGNAAADAAHLRTMTMETSWGTAWRLQFGAGFAAFLGFVLGWQRQAVGWIVAALACLALAFATALGGHAGAAENARIVALLADTIHVLAASAWMGSLAWLLVVGLGVRGTAIPLVKAFSPLALTSAALVMLTGITSAWLRLGTLHNLWSSSYGQVLLLKLLVLAGVAGSGFYNWKRARPALGAEGATERLQRSASIELAFALGVVIVTAVLVAMPLPAT